MKNLRVREIVVEAGIGVSSVTAMVEAAQLAFAEMRSVRLVYDADEFLIDPKAFLGGLFPIAKPEKPSK